MSIGGADPKKLSELQQKFIRELRDKIRKDYTPLQREFFGFPDMREEGDQYALQHHGSKAWLSACGEAIHLEMIQTEDSRRGQGHASQLLQMLCSFADKVGVTLELRAEPKARKIGLVQEQLIEWYGRYGFKGGWEGMTRRPNCSVVGFTGEPRGSGEPIDG